MNGNCYAYMINMLIRELRHATDQPALPASKFSQIALEIDSIRIVDSRTMAADREQHYCEKYFLK
jgi:hypothetical protein